MRLNMIGPVAVLSLVFICLFSAMAAADPGNKNVSSTEMIESASALDGTSVLYSGEVVGDVLYRGNYAWINVSDGSNAIGVWVPAAEAKKIESTGRYRFTGDTVSVSGTFHRACTDHGGDMDIHADTVLVTEKGHAVEDAPSGTLMISAVIFFLSAFMAAGFMLKRKS